MFRSYTPIIIVVIIIIIIIIIIIRLPMKTVGKILCYTLYHEISLFTFPRF